MLFFSRQRLSLKFEFRAGLPSIGITTCTTSLHHHAPTPATNKGQHHLPSLLLTFVAIMEKERCHGCNKWFNDKEVLASCWYSQMYDQCITDPNTQFLLCLEAYVDKTAKSAGITSYAGEPFLLSAMHLKKSVREDSSAWFVQAYLPDLEVGSSAKKQQRHHPKSN